MDIKATDVCSNCFCEFADHNYVKNSINKYKCPHKKQEASYGFFHGGDPNNFTPDFECCTPAEIEAWDEACKKGVQVKGASCIVSDNVRITKSTFGIGVTVTEYETYFELLGELEAAHHGFITAKEHFSSWAEIYRCPFAEGELRDCWYRGYWWYYKLKEIRG